MGMTADLGLGGEAGRRKAGSQGDQQRSGGDGQTGTNEQDGDDEVPGMLISVYIQFSFDSNHFFIFIFSRSCGKLWWRIKFKMIGH